MEDITSKKILIVDDVSMSVAVIMKILKKLGFINIHEFTDSVEAWEAFAEAQLSDDPFDLVITDLNMPGLDGMNFISQIKGDEMSKDTKIIVVSADADPIVIDEAMELGALEYLTKPVSEVELKEKIEYVFNGFPFEVND